MGLAAPIPRRRRESATSRPSRIRCTKRASLERGGDPRHPGHVARGSCRPSAAFPPLGVEAVERAQRFGGVGAPGRSARASCSRSRPKSPQLRVDRDRLGELGPAGSAVGGVDQLGDELRLGRDRELRVGVEHHPQQRRPRAPDPDDERRRRAPCRRAHAYAGRRRRADQRAEQRQPVVGARQRVDRVLGMGHQPDDVAAPVADPRDVGHRAVRVRARLRSGTRSVPQPRARPASPAARTSGRSCA